MEGDKHPVQKLLDNPWILLVLGIVIPMVSYVVWAWIELFNAAPAALP